MEQCDRHKSEHCQEETLRNLVVEALAKRVRPLSRKAVLIVSCLSGQVEPRVRSSSLSDAGNSSAMFRASNVSIVISVVDILSRKEALSQQDRQPVDHHTGSSERQLLRS